MKDSVTGTPLGNTNTSSRPAFKPYNIKSWTWVVAGFLVVVLLIWGISRTAALSGDNQRAVNQSTKSVDPAGEPASTF